MYQKCTYKNGFRNYGLCGVRAEIAEYQNEARYHKGSGYHYKEEVLGSLAVAIIVYRISGQTHADGAQDLLCILICYIIMLIDFLFFYFFKKNAFSLVLLWQNFAYMTETKFSLLVVGMQSL